MAQSSMMCHFCVTYSASTGCDVMFVRHCPLSRSKLTNHWIIRMHYREVRNPTRRTLKEELSTGEKSHKERPQKRLGEKRRADCTAVRGNRTVVADTGERRESVETAVHIAYVNNVNYKILSRHRDAVVCTIFCMRFMLSLARHIVSCDTSPLSRHKTDTKAP